MSRVSLIDSSYAAGERQALLTQIHGAFGATPNMFKAVANSTAALKSMWGTFGALGSGVIPAKLGELIAVAVANRNACEYCLAAYTVLGRKAGASEAELAAAQIGQFTDPKTVAALRFAPQLVEAHGQVSESDVQAIRKAGFSNEEIVEILAHVALNLFTNYTNLAFSVPVDFPKVKLKG
jgi:uncharacterized peroxidase-related enzyme